MTSIVAFAAPAKLSKRDFSFGGEMVQGYSNFIDLAEADKNITSYNFDKSSNACKNANRGMDLDLYTYDEIKDKFGEPDKITEGKIGGTNYVYIFRYHGQVYEKIFYFILIHGEQEMQMWDIAYQVDRS